jgi:transcriptional/translational regulatory protein YebC/TACO1
VFEKAIEAGAEDVDVEGDRYEVATEPHLLHTVSDALQKLGLTVESAQITMVPKTTVRVEGKAAANVLKLMEALEDHDDVQNVYANFDISEAEMAAAVGK